MWEAEVKEEYIENTYSHRQIAKHLVQKINKITLLQPMQILKINLKQFSHKNRQQISARNTLK